MALTRWLVLLLLASPVSAFYNYTSQDLNGTVVNQTGEYVAMREGDWLWGSWLFWTNYLPAPLTYLPVALFVILIGFIGYVKTRSIMIPALWYMFFLTVAGITLWAALAPYLGYIVLGVMITAVIVAFLKMYYG